MSAPSERVAAPPPRLLALSDLGVVIGMPLLLAISWGTPQRIWRLVAHAFAPFYSAATSLGGRDRIASRLRRAFEGRATAVTPSRVIRDLIAEDIVSLLELLRDYRPRGWRPNIHVIGLQHVKKSIREGRGAILWVSHFVHADLVAKIAFHQAGLSVSHLSHPRHGFSSSQFGIRFLNRIQTAVEDRYLRARIRMGLDSSVEARTALERRIGENGVVSISVRGDSRRPVVLPFLGDWIRIAAGAPVTAHRTGAALIPVFPVRDAKGGYTVTFEPALDMEPALAPEDAVRAALRQYVHLLEHHVQRHPGQWLGWFAT